LRGRSSRQLRAALASVVRRPVRSGLTATGVALSVAALLVAEGMAERGRRGAVEQIRRMGADVLVIDALPSRNIAGRARSGTVVTTLREADAREIALRVPGAAVVSAEYRGNLPVKVGNLARRVAISGDHPSYAALREAPLARGRFFDAADETGVRRVAVLGHAVAVDLFGSDDVVGRSLRLGAVPFTAVGVLPERGTGLDAFAEDEAIFVPLATARRRLFNVDHVERIFVRAARGAGLEQVGYAITALLRERHPRAGREVDFRVQDQRRLVALQERTASQLRTFQLAVAAVLLAAGAGGVFGLVMLSVRERRAEIGIRRALGATRWEIFAHFLTEALVLSAAGSGGGAGLGLTVSAATDLRVPAALAGAAGCAYLTACLAAAAWPARHAAGLPAAEALRLL
jgi:ABC-type antimicrobial peptide transport system permease subunit